jgi:hypothetical protein
MNPWQNRVTELTQRMTAQSAPRCRWSSRSLGSHCLLKFFVRFDSHIRDVHACFIRSWATTLVGEGQEPAMITAAYHAASKANGLATFTGEAAQQEASQWLLKQ